MGRRMIQLRLGFLLTREYRSEIEEFKESQHSIIKYTFGLKKKKSPSLTIPANQPNQQVLLGASSKTWICTTKFWNETFYKLNSKLSRESTFQKLPWETLEKSIMVHHVLIRLVACPRCSEFKREGSF